MLGWPGIGRAGDPLAFDPARYHRLECSTPPAWLRGFPAAQQKGKTGFRFFPTTTSKKCDSRMPRCAPHSHEIHSRAMEAPQPTKPSARLLDPDTGEPYVSARGRKWGAVDIIDGDMRAHIWAAYASAGGAEYLRALAVSDVPSDRGIFGGLLGKLVPTEIKGNLAGNFTLELVNYAQQQPQPLTIDMPAHSPLLD